MDARPEVIVRLGDMWDMASLCSYDKGKKEFTMRSVGDDLEAGHHAETLIFGPMMRFNHQQRSQQAKTVQAPYRQDFRQPRGPCP